MKYKKGKLDKELFGMLQYLKKVNKNNRKSNQMNSTYWEQFKEISSQVKNKIESPYSNFDML